MPKVQNQAQAAESRGREETQDGEEGPGTAGKGLAEEIVERHKEEGRCNNNDKGSRERLEDQGSGQE